MRTNVKTSAHSKVILIGEHSVVYDKSAVVMPIKNLITEIDLTLEPDTKDKKINPEYLQMHRLTDALTNHFNYQDGFTIKMQSNIPGSRGLGSSASAAVAIIRAFFEIFETKLDLDTLINFAEISENTIHGKASDIDIIGTSSEYIIDLNDSQIEEIKHPPTFYLVIVDSKIKGSTKEAVETVANNPKKDQLISQLTTSTKEFKQALKDNNVIKLGFLMNQAQTILDKLGVSNATIDKLIKIALENNALGAKLSGSGLGGIVISITDDLSTAKNIQNGFLQAGFEDVLMQESKS